MPDHTADSNGHDPIDELTRFGAGLAGGDMPLSAAEVRRRGDRIRRRRTALVAGGAAVAVAAVTVPVLLVSGPTGPDRDLVTKDPAGLGRADLLTDDDTLYSDGADWFATQTFEGDGQAAFHLCARESLSGLGATAVLQREFELRNTRDPEVPVSGDRFAEAIAQFPDAATASAAYTTISQWVQDCSERAAGSGTPDYSVVEPRQVDAEVDDSQAQIIDAHYGPVPQDIDPSGDAAYIAETGLVRVGDRIAVLGSSIIGQDYNFVDGTPVERMIPVAADRLRPGANEPTDPTAAPGTRIPDGFPLTAGWPATGNETDQPLTGPMRGLDPIALIACGTSPTEPRRSDRLSAEWVDVEDVRFRQVTTHPSENAAAEVAAAIAAVYEACPEGPADHDGVPRWEVRDIDAGDEAFAVLGWQQAAESGGTTPFGDTTLVVRVGRAVLVETRGGHAGNPQGREQEVVDAISADAAPVVDAMCAFTAAGC
ncbi:hypothetical protein FHP29_09955 [Nocardioides albidus]|uniref:PknH-like extracellular domain-containing protein n=1 Tax=Nocardioides albidus TaxID=1517589 RepID=A0A5C4VYP8_9ACTN|nr:hypothetical protein [Nocardioides albidus]TNM40375.1 hypothetical protein FHP29_09955 [Nocardioides albidus]